MQKSTLEQFVLWSRIQNPSLKLYKPSQKQLSKRKYEECTCKISFTKFETSGGAENLMKAKIFEEKKMWSVEVNIIIKM